jgi:putative membrane protein
MGQYEYVSSIPRKVLEGAFAALGGNTEPLVEVLVPFAVFGAGALVGLFSVAYAVRAALARYRQGTLVFLVSLMVGALRLPGNEVMGNVSAASPGTVVLVSIPLVAGATAVLVLDRYTDDLQY